VCALLDEAAFFRGEDSQVNDTEILKAVAPRILPGGQVLILSTPWVEHGVLFDLHKNNFADPKSALVAHAPTLSMRDDEHTRDFVRRDYLRDFDTAERELGIAEQRPRPGRARRLGRRHSREGFGRQPRSLRPG